LAEYLVRNVEGMETADESLQIGQELIKLNVMRPVSVLEFNTRPGSFYFFMVRARSLGLPSTCGTKHSE
jgi:hypothetical protein